MDEQIAVIVSMGFDPTQAQRALTATGGNVDRAIDRLLTGGDPSSGDDDVDHHRGGSGTGSAPASHQDEYRNSVTAVVRSDTSQYTVPGGRSACTCIALATAESFLSSYHHQRSSEQTTTTTTTQPPPPPRWDEVVTPSFLERMVLSGVEAYNRSLSQGGGGGGVEHRSAEEILAIPGAFDSLTMVGGSGVRQGILSSDRHHPLGLRAVMDGSRNDPDGDGTEWMAMVITKSPETVVVCLPPPTTGGVGGYHALLDSHPRPQLETSGSYGIICRTFDGLVGTLERVFPVTDLGPDVPEMMAMMYNSFDLYPFQLRKKEAVEGQVAAGERSGGELVDNKELGAISSSDSAAVADDAANRAGVIPSNDAATTENAETNQGAVSTGARDMTDDDHIEEDMEKLVYEGGGVEVNLLEKKHSK